LGASGEDLRDCAGAGADFDDGCLRDIAERICNGDAGRGIDEKILT
jgi:hypothetical protein